MEFESCESHHESPASNNDLLNPKALQVPKHTKTASYAAPGLCTCCSMDVCGTFGAEGFHNSACTFLERQTATSVTNTCLIFSPPRSELVKLGLLPPKLCREHTNRDEQTGSQMCAYVYVCWCGCFGIGQNAGLCKQTAHHMNASKSTHQTHS